MCVGRVWITQSRPGLLLEVRPKSASLVARGSLTSRSTQHRIVDRDDVLAMTVVRCGPQSGSNESERHPRAASGPHRTAARRDARLATYS